jgi:competence protein ComFC
MYNIIQKILRFAAPHDCIICQKEGDLICNSCRYEHMITVASRCAWCHKLQPDSRTCKNCRKNLGVTNLWVSVNYSGLAKELVYQTKFYGKREGALIMAQSICDNMPYLKPDTVVISVATASSRMRQRGFDHTKILASEFAALRDLKYTNCLQKIGQKRQVGANRSTRLEQIEGSFSVIRPSRIVGRDVILVDDVLSTGATIAECAAVLRAAGAKSIKAAVFAQKT